ncbi:S41 family peptidase [Butyrivibrio sp. MC2013]|uniref:S41 family peptidase n=1 Tax=Butyrivibrio sp. MC2013 TaxID=1280686 RepID=UPI0003FEA9BD|nr:S41 family peptidase [Butyrivibrio sp. MC2013]
MDNYYYNNNYPPVQKKKGKGLAVFLGILIGVILGMAMSAAFVILVVMRRGPEVHRVDYNEAKESLLSHGGEASASSAADKDEAKASDDENKAYEDDEEEYISIVNDEVNAKLQLLEDTIEDNYLDASEISASELENGIYTGMLDSLGDPYSVYYTEEQLTELMSDTEGIYYGIGAYISLDQDTGLPVISGIMEGTPAQEAGLMAGDICYKVDGIETDGMTLEEFVSKVKGEEHTIVTLTLYRQGESDFIEQEVERRKVETPTVSHEMKEGDIGYIKISEFDTVTTQQFADALEDLQDQGMRGLVLDLRSNPGGSLAAVCDIAKMILPKGVIVYTVDKDGKRIDYECNGKNELDVPMTVLVNGYSASASEILAGAIKDYNKGTLIGTTTYGKGIVQKVIPFSDGTAVKLTVSKYYTPSGVNIHGTGIEPDIELDYDIDAYKENGSDNQLNRALQEVAAMLN